MDAFRPRFQHGSQRRPGEGSPRRPSSRTNPRAAVQDAGVAPPLRPLAWSSGTRVSSTPSSSRRKPTGKWEAPAAGSSGVLPHPARPTLAAHNEGVTLGAGCVGAPTSGPPRPTVAPPAAQWEQRVAASEVGELGPTFALSRSSSDVRREGVMAPTCLMSLGITDMLTFADCFASAAEVRDAWCSSQTTVA